MSQAKHDDTTSAVTEPAAALVERARLAREKLLDIDAALSGLEEIRRRNGGGWCEGIYDTIEEALHEYGTKRAREALDALEPFDHEDTPTLVGEAAEEVSHVTS